MYERNHLLRSYGLAGLPVMVVPVDAPPDRPLDPVGYEKAPR